MFLAAMRPGDTPVPIPNTTVKTRAADGTALETVWESRWLPDNLAKCSMFLAAMRPGDTPVPIPNTTVKTRAADGTALETVWESRWLPD